MNRFYITAVALSTFGALSTFAQEIAPPRIQWQKRYGGDSGERFPCLQRTADGGFILGGHSYSGISGNKGVTNYGRFDYWVLRLDRNGTKLWEADAGGWDQDFLYAVQEVADGGVILAGWSSSWGQPNTEAFGNKTAPRRGDYDYWVVRLDATGTKLWDRSFGGNCGSEAKAVLQTADGGFLVAGSSCSSAVGNKTSPSQGLNDFWIVRLDANGERLWDRVYGGLQNDHLTDARLTLDQGFILAGYSNSGSDGFKSATNYGGNDLWLVRIDADGNKLWDRSYGGANHDGLNARVIVTGDNGFLVGASTMSGMSGNKVSPFGGGSYYGDYWVLRVDSEGNKLWEKDFGGTREEVFSDVLQTIDGGFIAAGWLSAATNAHVWLVRLDSVGTKIWDETYDGPEMLAWPRLQPTSDGGMMMAASAHVDFSEPIANDLALLKLSADALTAPQLHFPFPPLSGNPFTFYLSGISNRTYVTEFSSDLAGWSPLATNVFSRTPVEIRDSDATSATRFYRARMLE